MSMVMIMIILILIETPSIEKPLSASLLFVILPVCEVHFLQSDMFFL
jgi:hypothetical protein